ncbi:uncharacterized protein LOC115996750 isoform X2 [Ipomoea triloba]|nr:uncharacterized protein LOC115996750 isoform X2 [Ipomoea triloba]
MEKVAQFVNKIERALVTNITSDLSVVKALVVEFCTQNYMKAHVKHKVKCIDKEVDDLIQHLKNKREKKQEEEGNSKEKEVKKEERKLVKTSEWLISIGKKTEKIKNLVSQFGSLPEEESGAAAASSTTGGKREKQKTVSNSTECYKMCIEESLLISPIITGSLKKSYDHLPSNELKLCLLSLAAFPEDFIIKKRPLIYWWMSEGFVVENGNSKSSAEEVGEQNFTQLIQLGLIQPWYESGNTTDQPHNNVHVQGCSVHPWIRRMLVPIAMEARLFEFFGVPKEEEHPPMTMTGNPRSRRVCLYDDGDGEGVEHTATWKTRNRKYHKLSEERLKWIKAQYYRVQRGVDKELLLQMPKDIKEVSERQKKLILSSKFITDLNNLVAEVAHGKVKHGSDDDDALLAAVNKRLNDLKTRIEDDDVGNNITELHDEQMKLQNEIEGLHKQFQVRMEHQINYLDRVLDPKWVNDSVVVYNRKKNCEILQEKEVLFGHNDLNNPFPFPFLMKEKNNKRTTARTSSSSSNADQNEQAKKSDEEAERLLAIINVTLKYLDMDHEPFGKMKWLRTLHLGRWRDSLPVPHIEVENDRIFEALFHVANHLKYLSLRGISRITSLPSTISKCCNLQILDLKACYNLETLPTEINKLYKLTHLDVSECYLLQTNLWSLVQNLQCLQTLKGLKLDQSTLNSLQALAASGTLRKLSIILTTPTFNIDLLTSLSKLCILTITWRITPDTQPKVSTENLPQQQQAAEEISANTETTSHPKPEKSGDDGGGASTENPAQQQPAGGEISANTETTPHPKPEISDANTESTPQKNPEKSDGASTRNQPQKNPTQKSDEEEEEGIEVLPNLKKLDLRCYPDKTWPNWVKKFSSLETLYITGGDLEEFPMLDLDLQKLQLLRFKYLTKLKLGQDFNTSQLKSTKFPSLITFLNHDSKPKK